MSDSIDTTSPLVRRHQRHFLDKIATRLGKTTFLVSEARRHERPWLRAMKNLLTGAVGFTTSAASLNGTDTYLTATDAVIGIADSKTYDIEFWLIPGGDGTERVILSNDDGAGGAAGIRVYLDTSNRLNVVCKNAAGTTIFADQSLSNGYIAAMGMCNVHISGDMATGVTEMLWNGFDDSNIQTAVTNDTIDYTKGQWTIGADGDGSQVFNGSLGEMFGIFDQTPKDYSMATGDANHALFVTDADLRPVDLGSDGSTPYTNQPEIYWKGDATSSVTIVANAGSGGAFTENQPLGSSAVTPDNFVFRLPMTDFPGVNEAYVGSGFNIDADGQQLMLALVVEMDVLNGPYILDYTRSNIFSETAGLNIEIQSTAGVSFDGTFAGHNSIGTKRLYVFAIDTTITTDGFVLYVNGVDVIADLVGGHTWNTGGTLDFTNGQLKYGQLVTALLELNGGMGSVLSMNMAPGDIDISAMWDSVNEVPKWPGRKGENWTNGNGEALTFSILPGGGLKRVFFANIADADLTEEGTSFPLLPRTTWFAP